MLQEIYGAEADQQQKRYEQLIEEFRSFFGREPEIICRAPGRVELGGNHTDHQRGKVLAAALTVDLTACAAPRSDGKLMLKSENHRLTAVNLRKLAPSERDRGKTVGMIRGVAAGLTALGADFSRGGLDVLSAASVPNGGGLSSSAAFEVMTAYLLAYGTKRCPGPVELAQIGQYAENVYFGKPSGLMDQLASSLGGTVAIDFGRPKHPETERLSFSPEEAGYALCLVNCGAGHEKLNEEYAAIPADFAGLSRYFGKKVLREVPEEEFYAEAAALRREAGDRAFLRGCHFYAENHRVEEEVKAIKAGDMQRFLALVRDSGRSSAMYLQNIIPVGRTSRQELMTALALCEKYAGPDGAVRVHGGGFGGTAEAFVPLERLDEFRREIGRILGEESFRRVFISPKGGVCAAAESFLCGKAYS